MLGDLGAEVIKILLELHAEGHTIIMVTHDMQVAAHADRIIELSDGRVVSDRLTRPDASPTGAVLNMSPASSGRWQAARDRFSEAFRMALLAMNAHRLRTFLTMLGIIIGIASVVSVVALGEGSRQQILSNISAIGTNTIEVFSGTGFGDQRAARVRTLVPSDAAALAGQDYVDSVTPSVSSSATLRYGNIAVTGTVQGVGFRPWVYRVARELGVVGKVGNDNYNNVSKLRNARNDAQSLARELEAGMTFINQSGTSRLGQKNIPFGDVKQSGIGRESSEVGLAEYVQYHGINYHKR